MTFWEERIEEEQARANRLYGQPAKAVAERDGIPEKGSDEIRLHAPPPPGDGLIATGKYMVSFRVPRFPPLALVEQLWADGENTHLVDRTAVAVNPKTGRVYDMNLFFQGSRGDHTSVLAQAEINIDLARKKTRREKDLQGQKKDPNQHVVQFRSVQAQGYRSLSHAFQRAAEKLGVSVSEGALEQNRRLFRIHPSSLTVHIPTEEEKRAADQSRKASERHFSRTFMEVS